MLTVLYGSSHLSLLRTPKAKTFAKVLAMTDHQVEGVAKGVKSCRLCEAVAVAVEALRQDLSSGEGGTDHISRTPWQQISCVDALQ